MRAAAEGQDVVVACPGWLLGAGDVNRINTFAIEEYLRGNLRTTVAGGIACVDVRDVAEGLLAAERRGVSGRRYILTSEDGNLTHRELFDLAGEVDGKRRRTFALPPALLARRRADRARAAAAAAAQPRGGRERVPLLVPHACPGDGRARLPAAPGARGDGGDREVPARLRPKPRRAYR